MISRLCQGQRNTPQNGKLRTPQLKRSVAGLGLLLQLGKLGKLGKDASLAFLPQPLAAIGFMGQPRAKPVVAMAGTPIEPLLLQLQY
jgi:hypothetical protein